jgi:hypothetical protein
MSWRPSLAVHALVNVSLAVLQHAIDQSGESVDHRGNGFGSAEPGAQSTVLGFEIAGAAATWSLPCAGPSQHG